MTHILKYLLYNPYSGNNSGETRAKEFATSASNGSKLVNMTEISSYSDFFDSMSQDDEVIICGGDGTLNRFINDLGDLEPKLNIYYYPIGTGNDFYADVCDSEDRHPILINDYIKNLPIVTVKGKDYKFLNGVGYGIDGYCCEEGDRLHENGKDANYTAIAIKGLLFHFKPVNATVTVDGKESKFSKVWIAPTMHGRRYGGGMIPTPAQERNNDKGTVSLMVFHGSGKLKTLMIFPSIFKGEHVKHTENISVLCGNEINVKFDSPRALQIDGETVLGVEEYSVRTNTSSTQSNG